MGSDEFEGLQTFREAFLVARMTWCFYSDGLRPCALRQQDLCICQALSGTTRTTAPCCQYLPPPLLCCPLSHDGLAPLCATPFLHCCGEAVRQGNLTWSHSGGGRHTRSEFHKMEKVLERRFTDHARGFPGPALMSD